MLHWGSAIKTLGQMLPEDALGSYYSVLRRSLVATVALTGISKTHFDSPWMRYPMLALSVPAIAFAAGWSYAFTGLMVAGTTIMQDKFPNASKLVLSNTMRQIFTTYRLTSLAAGAGSSTGVAMVIAAAGYALHHKISHRIKQQALADTSNLLDKQAEPSPKGNGEEKKVSLRDLVGSSGAHLNSEFRAPMKASLMDRMKASTMALVEYWNAFILTGRIKGKVDPWLILAVGMSWYNNVTNPTLNSAEKEAKLKKEVKEKAKKGSSEHHKELIRMKSPSTYDLCKFNTSIYASAALQKLDDTPSSPDSESDSGSGEEGPRLQRRSSASVQRRKTKARGRWKNVSKAMKAGAVAAEYTAPTYLSAMKKELFGADTNALRSLSFRQVVDQARNTKEHSM